VLKFLPYWKKQTIFLLYTAGFATFFSFKKDLPSFQSGSTNNLLSQAVKLT
jgi:hypothetical protein